MVIAFNITIGLYIKNIDDFIKQINISMDNLELTKNKGLSEGLSNLLIENINKLSVYERPLHCTDSKRDTLYIKDNNVWEKDDDKVTSLMDKSDKELQHKYVILMNKWEEEHPGWEDNEKLVEEYMNMSNKVYDNIDNKNKLEIFKDILIPKQLM